MVIGYSHTMIDLSSAIKQVCDEKNIPYESVIATIEYALAAAYRKDFGNKLQNIQVNFDADTGNFKVFDVKTVVEDLPEAELLSDDDSSKQAKADTGKKKDKEKKQDKKTEKDKAAAKEKSGGKNESEKEEEPVFNPKTQIQLKDAKKNKKKIKIKDEIKTKLEVPGEFGRMAAQTAKQVIMQRLREAERETIFKEYKEKQGQMATGVVQRVEGRMIMIDLGKATALLPPPEQIRNEKYYLGLHIKVIILNVATTPKGPEITVSRIHPNMVKELFFLEVPEINTGTVEIMSIAREAGQRSKVAVRALEENIDPIGSCVGQRGTRVQTIINELGGEKIDIIEYKEEPSKFIEASLSPAKVQEVKILDKEKKGAQVIVKEENQSLAIGKGGQNVRLAAKLTGWKIDIKQEGADEKEEKKEKKDKRSKKQEKSKADKEKKKPAPKKEAKKDKNENKEKKSKKNEKVEIILASASPRRKELLNMTKF